ncbi:MAG TPA: HD domain-containing phosphohydrolase [Actinomycetota bacterium]|nr:HD domain-containing phosphohydrolase [Actinomycetota bacterium]
MSLVPAGLAPGHVRVVVTDDQPHMRLMLTHALSIGEEFEVVGQAADGAEAVELVESMQPDVLLIDLAMPNMDGFEAIKRIRRRGSRVRILVLTSNGDRASIAQAMENGADGYVLKGAGVEEIRVALRDVAAGGAVLAPAIAREVVDGFIGLVEEKRRRDVAVIRTLAAAVEARDRVTGDHINNVANLSVALWTHMVGSKPDEEMVYGFLLHDVGKISIPDSILLKPGKLDDDEMARMRRHVEVGLDLIEPLGFGRVVTDVIRCHHERFDGEGYPNGLRGEQIPIHARMFSVVDAYDAMTADRPYRKGMPPADALAELRRFAGTQFDPDCVDGFEALAVELGFA